MVIPKLLAVVHHLNAETTLSQASLAIDAGASGVFLISHHAQDDDLFEPAMVLKGRYPNALLGLNLLSSPPLEALHKVASIGLDMVWCDAPGVTSAKISEEALSIRNYLIENSFSPMFFGSVAFKYQEHEPSPANAALLAHALGMIPTTSGKGTGTAPNIEKVSEIKKHLGANSKLAIASGMTPENVTNFVPHVDYLLVSTGISKDAYHFDEALLKQFVHNLQSAVY